MKHCTYHWWVERVTAVLLLILLTASIMFVICDLWPKHPDASTVPLWPYFSRYPLFTIITLTTAFYHANLGMQVIIEDYISNIMLRYSLITITSIISIVTCLAGIIALFSAKG